MKRIILQRFLVLSLSVTIFSCTSSLKREYNLGEPASISLAPAAAKVQTGNSLKITAKLLKPEVTLGEPVYLALQVTNDSSQELPILGGLRSGEGLIQVFIKHANDKAREFNPYSKGDFNKTLMLKPSQTIGNVFPIFFGADGWIFTQPGQYSVFVEFNTPTDNGFYSFRSEPALLTVKDSAAGKLLVSQDEDAHMQAGQYLLWRSGDHLQKGKALLNSVSERYPGSVLADYINAAHARSLSEPFANYLEGKVRPADCRKAALIRNNLNTAVLPENLLIEDQISKAKCFAENAQWQEAKAALQAADQLCASQPEFRGYKDRIAEMKKLLSGYLG